MKISRLYSHKQDKFVTLQEYVDQMAENQKSIYYLASENLTSAKRSPHLEGFAENGIDVLLLTDPIDEFWVSMVPNFSDKPLTSISREKVDLSEFSESEQHCILSVQVVVRTPNPPLAPPSDQTDTE